MTARLILHPHAEFLKLEVHCQRQISQEDESAAVSSQSSTGLAALVDSPLLERIEQPGIQDVLLRLPRVVPVQRGERAACQPEAALAGWPRPHP